jgi:hypothetical protein
VSKVTLVYAYYENPDMLRRHLEEWRQYSIEAKTSISVIVVDDGSPTHSAVKVTTEFGYTGVDLRVYRVKEDIPWNQDGARNIGMFEAQTEWCLMMDMDHLLTKSQVDEMLKFVDEKAEPRVYYMPNQHTKDGVDLQRPHPNGYLFRRSDFWAMGGYDEDFAGWYGSDGNFRKCAKGLGLIEAPITDFYTVVYRSTDILDANTKLSRKDGPMYAPLNPLLNAKRKGPAYYAKNPLRCAYQRLL